MEPASAQPKPLSSKQQIFVAEYTACWNATEAARRAGYKDPAYSGWENQKKPAIQAAIKARLAEVAMPADEVLARLGQHARGSMGDFIKLGEDGAPAGFDLGPERPQHLIRKVSITDKAITFELYDAQAALAILAKHHGLLVERADVHLTANVKGYRTVSPDDWDGDAERPED